MASGDDQRWSSSDPVLRAPTLVDWIEGAETEGLGGPTLPRLVLGVPANPGSADLVLGELLGSGGMATVRRARQVVLDREVAVKRAREPGNPRIVRGLLREAVLGARLQHPNIVPIHFVGETREGEPLVVMQAIEGLPWSALLEDEDVPLERHLEIFHAVCRAVAYAHAQGVLHRDIKPSNVRIGEFGEVYLLDWGIAARLSDPEAPAAGTRAYMPPEAVRSGPPDVRSDVHALGATLLHVIAGDAPGRTGSMEEATLEPVVVPDTVPEGLDAVLRRACAPDPNDRHPTVEALRQDVATWQQDQEVRALFRAAEDRLARLQEAEEAHETRERFAVARFAFEQVLAVRPEHPGASRGLVRCFDHRIRREAADGNRTAVEALLDAHPVANPALRDEVEATLAAHARHAAERQRLQEIARNHDLASARKMIQRLMTLAAVSAVLAVVFANALLGPAGPRDAGVYPRMVVLAVVICASLALGTIWLWPQLRESPAGRRAVGAVLGAQGLLVVERVLLWAVDARLADGSAVAPMIEPGLLAAVTMGAAVASVRFVWPTAFTLVGWMLLWFAVPDRLFPLAYNGVMLSWVGLTWLVWRQSLNDTARARSE